MWSMLKNHLHLKCTDLNKNTYQRFSDEGILFVSIAHITYSCITCEKCVFDKQDGNFCDVRNLWMDS